MNNDGATAAITATVAATAFLLALAAALLVGQPAPTTAPPAAYAGPAEQWSAGLARALGNDAPTAETIAFLIAWQQAEDELEGGAFQRNNPLNTTMEMPGAWTVNGDGVRGYVSYESGIAATAATLRGDYPGYADIRAGITTNDPERALRGLYAAPWGTDARTVDQLWRRAAATGCPLAQCVLSGYGFDPITHPGVDLAASLGEPVMATMDGAARVSQTWPCGLGIEVFGDGGRSALMCHLSDAVVADGASVVAGQLIGHAGQSGQAYGVHVHYEERVNGVSIDPSEVVAQ